MSELSIIESTPSPVTVASLSQDLIRLGVQEGDVLLVHSSLSSMGWVCGGAHAVILALQEVLGPSGTLIMPAHSGQISDPAAWENPPVPKGWMEEIYAHMPAFDPGITPTLGMGAIAELFRTIPGTLRSSHPQVSFSARGPLAKGITEDHPLTPQFGTASPLGKLVAYNAKILLLGIGFDSCTILHLAEALHPAMPRKEMGAAIMEEGQRIWKWFEDYDYDSDDFAQLGADYEAAGGEVANGKVANADCKLLSANPAVAFAFEWLSKHRFSES
ncbi:aminoglycoside N(3)-acetyltransferase [Paenibacillus terrigena]|uniref:aminoglycoside N(3)-acetyltransferase n=1 Tax=Paenibacillus terrigena TaxID=369333 RepID=UPI0003689648|nr:AAC(3) family N-acetyltransferase [Paenibacillus terrigena]